MRHYTKIEVKKDYRGEYNLGLFYDKDKKRVVKKVAPGGECLPSDAGEVMVARYDGLNYKALVEAISRINIRSEYVKNRLELEGIVRDAGDMLIINPKSSAAVYK